MQTTSLLYSKANVVHLAEDDRYSSHSSRGANQAGLDALVAAWTGTLEADRVLELMAEHGVPAGKIYRAPDMLEDPHFKARNAIIEALHPGFGKLRMQNVAPKLSLTPGAVHSPAPELGEHTAAVLGDLLGIDGAAIGQLRDTGVI